MVVGWSFFCHLAYFWFVGDSRYHHGAALTRERPAFTASESVLEELTAATNDFQPMADKIIEEVWQDKVVPVADAAKTELGKSLEWLEENSRSFARQILNGLAEVQEKLFFSSGVTLSDELYQLQKKMEEEWS